MPIFEILEIVATLSLPRQGLPSSRPMALACFPNYGWAACLFYSICQIFSWPLRDQAPKGLSLPSLLSWFPEVSHCKAAQLLSGGSKIFSVPFHDGTIFCSPISLLESGSAGTLANNSGQKLGNLNFKSWFQHLLNVTLGKLLSNTQFLHL